MTDQAQQARLARHAPAKQRKAAAPERRANARLKLARKRLGLSQTALAAKAHVSHMSVWRAEQGESPSFATALAIAGVLHQPVEWIFGASSDATVDWQQQYAVPSEADLANTLDREGVALLTFPTADDSEIFGSMTAAAHVRWRFEWLFQLLFTVTSLIVRHGWTAEATLKDDVSNAEFVVVVQGVKTDDE